MFAQKKLIRALADIAEHIFTKLKEYLMGTFSCNALTSISSSVAVVIKGLIIWGSKCHAKHSPVVWGGYVKYEEAEFDILVAICEKQITVAADRVEQSKQQRAAKEG